MLIGGVSRALFSSAVQPVRDAAAAAEVRPPREDIGGDAVKLGPVSGGESDAAVTASPDAADTGDASSERDEAGARETAEEARRKAAREAANRGELSDAEKKMVAELKARDREVRAHEAAHKAAAGALGSAPTYTYETGPDGRRYAVGGEVQIQVGEGRTPEETVRRARQIRAAATAPAEPSGQDLKVAAQASAMEQRAQAELRAEQREENRGSRDEGDAISEGEASAASEGDAGETPAEALSADRLEKAASELTTSYREGGVGGGHLHTPGACETCRRGAAAYKRSAA